uniref:Macaca fascicularis brain cDNA, clone: QflA-23308 n=1 Tax=Macaca fascicularis TaxID=9541 RepID=I7GDP7_MACFA|nr:unnamed protein product [Macaca fascicularis]
MNAYLLKNSALTCRNMKYSVILLLTNSIYVTFPPVSHSTDGFFYYYSILFLVICCNTF